MYEHAKKTLASIGNTGESTLDLPEFDWSQYHEHIALLWFHCANKPKTGLASWDLDAMTSLDATLPSFYF